MHVHTVYSNHWFWGTDALNTPREMIKAAIRRGLDGLAITDHENVNGGLVGKKEARRIKKDFKIIVGSEIKTLSGHMLAYGIKKNVQPGLSVEETIEKIHDIGGMAVAAHPYAEFGIRKCMKDKAMLADAIEVFNSSSCRSRQNRKALQMAEMYKKPMTAGSDAHLVKSVGNGGIICSGDPLESIRKGKVEIFGELTPLRVITYHLTMKILRSLRWKLLRQDPKKLRTP